MYDLFLSERTLNELKDIDKQIGKMILAWAQKNLQNESHPKKIGRSMFYKKNIFKFKIGQYRILAKVEEENSALIILDIRHQKDLD